MSSLRSRLLVLILSFLVLVWLAAAAFSYMDAHHEIDEIFDAQLAQSAKTLAGRVDPPKPRYRDEDDDHDEKEHKREKKHERFDHPYERHLAYQVWGADGTLIARSPQAPAGMMAGGEGFSDAEIDGKSWRIFSYRDEERGIMVQVGEQHHARDELSMKIAFKLLLPLVFALPILALLVWLGVGRGLSPLERLRREVAQRAPDNLTPVEAGQAPDEVAPLVNALNSLLSRVGQALDNERRFTDDAAHELRTPLAALKTQAQVALRANEDVQRRQALENVLLGVERATRLVEQLLTLARLDPQANGLRLSPQNLAEIARQAAADAAPLAVEKNIDLSVEADESLTVQGDAALLAILARNLADNAVRYTPVDGQVAITVAMVDGVAQLRVSDSGSGIPPEEREKIFERFHRILGSGESGSGLGLSIVQRIAELHGTKVDVREGEMGGAEFVVGFSR